MKMKIISENKLFFAKIIAIILAFALHTPLEADELNCSQAILTLRQMAEVLTLDPGNRDALSTADEILQSQARLDDSLFWQELCNLDRQTILTLYNNGIQPKRYSSIGIELSLIPKGSVQKSVVDTSGMMPVNKDVTLTLSKGFWISSKEITVGEYIRYLNDSKTFKSGRILPSDYELESIPLQLDDYNCYTLSNDLFTDSKTKPMTMVSYDDALDFCRWLSRIDNRQYTLPTEVQWELAARGGQEFGPWFFGNDQTLLRDYCWYDRNYLLSPAEVGKKKVNLFGLYDIYGNLWEWCLDWYLPNPWPAVPFIKDPAGPNIAIQRVIRGGSWQSSADKCNSEYRSSANPNLKDKAIGFRVVVNSQ